MGLYKQIEDDAKNALRKGDVLRLSVLRMVLSVIKTLQIDKNIKELDEAAISQVIGRQIKQRRDSIEQFRKGNRIDLAEKEESELAILESYLPKQLSEIELAEIVKTTARELNLKSRSDTGRLIKAVMERAAGRADGKFVAKLAGEILQ